jgi:energy-coupling factor transporter ATP-binding protein EcfA2
MRALSIAVQDLSVWRRSRSGELSTVLEHISFQIAAGERSVIAGPNGAGKSSLLLALVGALGTRGRILVGDRELDRGTLDEVRRDVGLVFEDPREQLFLDTVEDEVAFGPRQRGINGNELTRRVGQALEAVKLSGFEQRHPLALSFGEQRRLAVACVLASEPKVLLFDEPTANLDPLARRVMLDVIRSTEATVVVATHDLDAALEIGDKVLLLRSGALVDEGPARQVLTDRERLHNAGLALPLAVAALQNS